MFGIVYLLNCAAAYSGMGACFVENRKIELEQFIHSATTEQLKDYTDNVSSVHTSCAFIEYILKGCETGNTT